MRFAGLLVFVAFLAGCASVPPGAGEVREFRFPYIHDYSVPNRTTFAWSDSFLARDSYVYSQELAGPLSALAASTYGYRLDMDVASLAGLGFSPAVLYRRYGADLDYADPRRGKDQVGFTLALKRVWLDDAVRDVLFVLVRGTYGRDEWLSNMNACNAWGRQAAPELADMPALHEGFERAAHAVREKLADYIRTHHVDLPRAKVVVTGHSRGAAVANILGAWFDEGLPPFAGVRPENVFVYTFATPNSVIRPDRVACKTARYGNIFNVINPEDIVPHVPIAKWNACRYGSDLFLKNYDGLSLWGVWTDAGYTGMKRAFKDMTGYDWWHAPLGTNSTLLVSSLLGVAAPTVADLYAVPADQRADGNLTSIHGILETILYRSMDAPSGEADAHASLGGDISGLTRAYAGPGETDAAGSAAYFHTPDGRDFSRQPGVFDLPWRFSCMHATQTYIGWMKAAERHGPQAIYKNWKELEQ
ncbi:MAG: lipase family protein [Kiritimatiellia bacterium]